MSFLPRFGRKSDLGAVGTGYVEAGRKEVRQGRSQGNITEDVLEIGQGVGAVLRSLTDNVAALRGLALMAQEIVTDQKEVAKSVGDAADDVVNLTGRTTFQPAKAIRVGFEDQGNNTRTHYDQARTLAAALPPLLKLMEQALTYGEAELGPVAASYSGQVADTAQGLQQTGRQAMQLGEQFRPA